MITASRLATPIGDLLLTASDSALTGVYFSPFKVRSEWQTDDRHPVIGRTRAQLNEYFAGTRTTFDVPLDAAGSPFEQSVWALLRAIPYGTTTSYGDLARRLGDIRQSRAVGAANGKNPIPIIVPCHRVVGVNGDLTGFGGGLDRKRWLLEHEGALLKIGA